MEMNVNAIEMPKIDMVYEGPNSSEPLQLQSAYEKHYKTHTELTNPSYTQ